MCTYSVTSFPIKLPKPRDLFQAVLFCKQLLQQLTEAGQKIHNEE